MPGTAPEQSIFETRPPEAGPWVRALCLAELRRALARLDGTNDPDGRVHDARRACKRVRALLRLGRDALPRAVRNQEDRAIRDAARCIAVVRETGARREAARTLARSLTPERRAAWKTWARATTSATHDVEESLSAMAAARDLLRAVAARVEDWENEPWYHTAPVWDVFASGLRRMYLRAGRDFRRARREPSTEGLHEWRKHVKALMHVIDALAPVWPPLIATLRPQLDALAERLGADHDLAALDEVLAPAGDDESDPEPAIRMRGEIAARRAALFAEAHELGARLFAERPGPMLRRARGYFAAFEAGAGAGETAGG
jgi:CHAD domain-containing protein